MAEDPVAGGSRDREPPGEEPSGGDSSILDAIGGTPLVRLGPTVPEAAGAVWMKLEGTNPTGSYKDRMARAIVEAAERRGDLEPGMTVVECSGGSTGSSLAMVCAAKGYRLRVVTSDAFAAEKLATMRALGAELEVLPSEGGAVTAGLIERMRERADELAERDDVYLADQFHNRDALDGYEPLGEELVDALEEIDVFCGAVGSAGMLTGAARAIRRTLPDVRIVAFEPAESPVITEGRSGPHGVEGVGVGFVPPLLDPELYDEARAVPEAEAREAARRLAREEGIFVGTSSGLNAAGAISLARELGPGATVATVACDTGLKYLAGELFGRSHGEGAGGRSTERARPDAQGVT